MTTNSPNPVDGDVQALIEQCKDNIDTLTVALKHCDQDEAAEIHRNMEVQKVALAALTAENLGYIRAEDAALLPFERKNTCVEVEIYNQRSFTTDLKVYTTPPAQLLRPVKLTDCEFGAVSHMSGGSKDYCNGFVDGTNNAIKAIREAGYEVKS